MNGVIYLFVLRSSPSFIKLTFKKKCEYFSSLNSIINAIGCTIFSTYNILYGCESGKLLHYDIKCLNKPEIFIYGYIPIVFVMTYLIYDTYLMFYLNKVENKIER